jgi:hypothetical protein
MAIVIVVLASLEQPEEQSLVIGSIFGLDGANSFALLSKRPVLLQQLPVLQLVAEDGTEAQLEQQQGCQVVSLSIIMSNI